MIIYNKHLIKHNNRSNSYQPTPFYQTHHMAHSSFFFRSTTAKRFGGSLRSNNIVSRSTTTLIRSTFVALAVILLPPKIRVRSTSACLNAGFSWRRYPLRTHVSIKIYGIINYLLCYTSMIIIMALIKLYYTYV